MRSRTVSPYMTCSLDAHSGRLTSFSVQVIERVTGRCGEFHGLPSLPAYRLKRSAPVSWIKFSRPSRNESMSDRICRLSDKYLSSSRGRRPLAMSCALGPNLAVSRMLSKELMWSLARHVSSATHHLERMARSADKRRTSSKYQFHCESLRREAELGISDQASLGSSKMCRKAERQRTWFWGLANV